MDAPQVGGAPTMALDGRVPPSRQDDAIFEKPLVGQPVEVVQAILRDPAAVGMPGSMVASWEKVLGTEEDGVVQVYPGMNGLISAVRSSGGVMGAYRQAIVNPMPLFTHEEAQPVSLGDTVLAQEATLPVVASKPERRSIADVVRSLVGRLAMR